MQRLRAAERERGDAREREKFLIRKKKESESMVREAMNRECNSRYRAVGGISKYITNLGKKIERYPDEVGRSGAAFASTKADLCSIDSNINGVREQSEGGEADWKGDVDRGRVGEEEGSEVRGLF